jgi:hypothetical protein
MKNLLVVLIALLFSNICFAKEIDCNRMGGFAALFTIQKDNGRSLSDIQSFINSGISDN